MKQAEASLKALEQDLDSVSCNARLKTCMIKQVDSNINLSEWKPFGKLATESTKVLKLPSVMRDIKLEMITANFVKEMSNVRTKSNDTVCDISGMINLYGGTLAFVDHFHNSVKVMDAKGKMVLSELVLTSEITDITRFKAETLAVTLPRENRITFVHVQVATNSMNDILKVFLLDSHFSLLTRGHSIVANGECNYIDCSNNKFVVSYQNPAKVEILSDDGKLLSSIKTDNFGNEIFERPTYVAFGDNADSVYVSDTSKAAVIKVKCDGRKLAMYKGSHLSSPSGLAVLKNGTVLVADSQNGSIHHLTSDCRNITILIKGELIFPSCICLNEVNDTLYISHDYISDRDFLDRKIRVYQLIPAVSKTV